MMRRLWPDRNPLRRAADRAEAAVMAGLLAMFLVGVPLAAVATAGLLARRALDRRRLAAWEAEWSRTGAQWTGRL